MTQQTTPFDFLGWLVHTMSQPFTDEAGHGSSPLSSSSYL